MIEGTLAGKTHFFAGSYPTKQIHQFAGFISETSPSYSGSKGNIPQVTLRTRLKIHLKGSSDNVRALCFSPVNITLTIKKNPIKVAQQVMRKTKEGHMNIGPVEKHPLKENIYIYIYVDEYQLGTLWWTSDQIIYMGIYAPPALRGGSLLENIAM